jgi:hypothetical protein
VNLVLLQGVCVCVRVAFLPPWRPHPPPPTHTHTNTSQKTGFWQFFHFLPKPSDVFTEVAAGSNPPQLLKRKLDGKSLEAFGLFKKGVKPEWEDPINMQGLCVCVCLCVCVFVCVCERGLEAFGL